jgi:hypothetical protein
MAGLLLVVLVAGACSDPSTICTADSPGVVIEVRDRVTGDFTPPVARGVVQDGEFQDSLRLWEWIEPEPIMPRSYAAAHERPGTYSVHLEVAGYESWDSSGIGVLRDECHVLTERFTAALQPAS